MRGNLKTEADKTLYGSPSRSQLLTNKENSMFNKNLIITWFIWSSTKRYELTNSDNNKYMKHICRSVLYQTMQPLLESRNQFCRHELDCDFSWSRQSSYFCWNPKAVWKYPGSLLLGQNVTWWKWLNWINLNPKAILLPIAPYFIAEKLNHTLTFCIMENMNENTENQCDIFSLVIL